jgi:hypothetical protein
MNSKKLNLKAKHNFKKIKLWLFFNSHSLVLSYFFTYLSKEVGKYVSM